MLKRVSWEATIEKKYFPSRIRSIINWNEREKWFSGDWSFGCLGCCWCALPEKTTCFLSLWESLFRLHVFSASNLSLLFQWVSLFNLYLVNRVCQRRKSRFSWRPRELLRSPKYEDCRAPYALKVHINLLGGSSKITEIKRIFTQSSFNFWVKNGHNLWAKCGLGRRNIPVHRGSSEQQTWLWKKWGLLEKKYLKTTKWTGAHQILCLSFSRDELKREDSANSSGQEEGETATTDLE